MLQYFSAKSVQIPNFEEIFRQDTTAIGFVSCTHVGLFFFHNMSFSRKKTLLNSHLSVYYITLSICICFLFFLYCQKSPHQQHIFISIIYNSPDLFNILFLKTQIVFLSGCQQYFLIYGVIKRDLKSPL